MLRTPEQLQQMLEERKRIQQRKKEREKQRYKKASEQVKQELKKRKKYQENQNNTVQEPLKYKYSLTIYQSPLIERETAEESLYQSWEEIKDAEDRNEGALNWEFLEYLIQKTKNEINKTCRRRV